MSWPSVELRYRAQSVTFPCALSTRGLLFRCVYASLRKHLENAPRALQKRKRKRQRECRLKEFIFTSLTWDCWFFFIHSICTLISLSLFLFLPHLSFHVRSSVFHSQVGKTNVEGKNGRMVDFRCKQIKPRRMNDKRGKFIPRGRWKCRFAEFLHVQPEETDDTVEMAAGQQLTPVPPHTHTPVHLWTSASLRPTVCLQRHVCMSLNTCRTVSRQTRIVFIWGGFLLEAHKSRQRHALFYDYSWITPEYHHPSKYIEEYLYEAYTGHR